MRGFLRSRRLLVIYGLKRIILNYLNFLFVVRYCSIVSCSWGDIFGFCCFFVKNDKLIGFFRF